MPNSDDDTPNAATTLHTFTSAQLVQDARVQAKGRIAQRQLYKTLVESWAVPVINWLSRRLDDCGKVLR